jgi:hypothetical protein
MLLLFYVIPVFYHTPTLVECSCGTSLVSRLRAKDLAGVGAEFAAHYLSVRISPILKTLVLGGIVAWLIPVIGTVWMGIAYWWSRRYSGWIRNLALVLFLLSLLPTGVLVFAEGTAKPLPDASRAGDDVVRLRPFILDGTRDQTPWR